MSETSARESAQKTALRRGGFAMEPAEGGAASALARSVAEYAALREASLTVAEAARRLGVDSSRVRQLLADRQLYGLQVEGTWRIPAFQLAGDRLVPGLDEVVPALPKSLHPVALYHWFTEPNPDLVSEGDRRLSPREWLLAGSPPRAVAGLAADLDSL
jgi:excisionase family DNA binding protein